ncbi:Coenzyme F420 hydrogenase/dehydrogenase, beta subunit C-terminal domain [Sphingomonas sp. DT-204]|uniref:Coenzyme F420 hydrogenase/dehydrogenase, beta subunit C-terminal domain n=1 Tax=Sphingomonas sp. DT-204 TaxID=3396166 RepID=UPI003F1DF80A
MTAPVSRHDIVASGLCIGCGGCAAAGETRMAWDRYGQLKPAAPDTVMRAPSDRLARTCPFSPAARNEDGIAAERFPRARICHPAIGRFEAAYVGHADEGGFRMDGSSGGLVSWVATEILRQGKVDGVAHVVAADPATEGRLFRYCISRTEGEVRAGAKSRYYPIDLSEVLREIREVPGRYAVVGIPCFIKAVHLQRAADPLLADRITTTLGLFCGHMKSARMVESFARQMGVEPAAVARVDYRRKRPERPANWYNTELTLRDGRTVDRDWWHLVEGDWGAGFFQNAACDFCDDVTAETADIAFGDAWVEPYSSDGRGTNVVVVRSPMLREMIEQGRAAGRLRLEPVDTAFVIATQDAGLRHRREGLAYRLTWRRVGLVPRKRVAPAKAGLPLRRRLVYRMRVWIGRWSHRLFALSRRTGWFTGYRLWARSSLALYQALTYRRGRLGKLLAILPDPQPRRDTAQSVATRRSVAKLRLDPDADQADDCRSM